MRNFKGSGMFSILIDRAKKVYSSNSTLKIGAFYHM